MAGTKYRALLTISIVLTFVIAVTILAVLNLLTGELLDVMIQLFRIALSSTS